MFCFKCEHHFNAKDALYLKNTMYGVGGYICPNCNAINEYEEEEQGNTATRILD